MLKIIKANFLEQLKIELGFEKSVGFGLVNRWEGAESYPGKGNRMTWEVGES